MNKSNCFVLIAALFVATSSVFGQAYMEQFTWDDEVWFDKIDSTNETDVQILYRNRSHEFAYDPSGNLFEYYFFRSVVYLQTDKAVDDYNKIYINISNALELLDYNARVLVNNSEPRLLGEEALKEGKNENGSTYNYFAIEGAEEGSIVDYYFVLKKYPSYQGSNAIVQSSSPINDYQFRIISPLNLAFTITPLNGEMTVYRDSTDSLNRVMIANRQNIPKLEDEGFSNDAKHQLALLYKLEDNLYTRNYNMFTYGSISQTIYESLSVLDKKSKKALTKFLKGADIDESQDDRLKILAIENYIKKNITKVDASAEQLSNITSITANKVASDYGMLRLCYHAFAQYDIPVQIVLTCNRYELEFSETIENYTFLDDYLLYFPSIDDYCMPSAQLYRVGLVPYGYLDNHGLFIREVNVGDIKTGAGKISYIKPYPAKHSRHDMWINASISEDLATAVVEMKEEMTGFNALNYQPFYDYTSADKLEELKESSVKNISEALEVTEVAVENSGADNMMVKPFIVNSKYENPEFVQMAGNKLLFKLGELIGPQAEMYQEEERKLDVVNTYNHGYYREIVFTIPDGYKCVNLDDLTMDIDPFDAHHTLFTSEYSIEGNKVTVKVNEVYDEIELPLEDFEAFRNVINAAADFNKITLILEKA